MELGLTGPSFFLTQPSLHSKVSSIMSWVQIFNMLHDAMRIRLLSQPFFGC